MTYLNLSYLALALVATAFALILYFTLTAEIKKWRNENLSLKLQIKELLSKLRASLPRSPFHGKRGKDKKPRKGHQVFAISRTGKQTHYANVKYASECLGISNERLTRIIRGDAPIPADLDIKLVKYLGMDNVSVHPDGTRHDSSATAVLHEYDADFTGLKFKDSDGNELTFPAETAERKAERARIKAEVQAMKCSPSQ